MSFDAAFTTDSFSGKHVNFGSPNIRPVSVLEIGGKCDAHNGDAIVGTEGNLVPVLSYDFLSEGRIEV
jgi:hypothetical protein